jgi:hypothetical protein
MPPEEPQDPPNSSGGRSGSSERPTSRGRRSGGDISPATFAKLAQHLTSLDEKTGRTPGRTTPSSDRATEAEVEAYTPEGGVRPVRRAGGSAASARSSSAPVPIVPVPGAPPPDDPWAVPGESGAGSGSGNGQGGSGPPVPPTRPRGSSRSASKKVWSRPSRKRLFRRRSRGRRILIWSMLLLVAGLIAFAAIVVNAYYHAYNAYSSLKQVPALVTQARRQLEIGQIPKGGVLDQATGLVGDAQAEIDHAGWPFRWVKDLPFLGRPIQAISLATDAAGKEAHAATIVNGLIQQILGPNAGAPGSHPPVFSNGVIDVALIESVAPSLDELVRDLRSADASIRAIPEVPFVDNLNQLKAEVLSESSSAVRLAERAQSSFALLPPFLGADRPKTYYIALQNPSDQRGTGGAVLAYAVMRFDNGKLSLANPLPGPISGIDPRKGGFNVPVTPAASWYLRETHVVHRLANGVNYSPDFPSAARSWIKMLESGETPRVPNVDGVIALDPYSVAAALHGDTIHVEQFGLTMPASQIPKFVMHDQYLLSKDAQLAVPGLLIGEAFKAITSPSHLVSLLHNLSATLTNKHIQVWMADPKIQGAVERLGWDGAIRNPARGDYLNLAYEKRVGNKVDYYLRQAADYDVRVGSSGGISSTYQLNLSLPIPQGQPADVVGRFTPYGADLAMFNLYVPRQASLTAYSPTGDFPAGVVSPSRFTDHVNPKSFREHLEGEFKVFTNTVLAWAGHPASIRYQYRVPGVVKTTAEGKVYTLTVQHQPMINAQRLVVHVHLPKGSDIVSLDKGWAASGDTITYTGVVTRDFTTSIVFR